MNTNEYPSRCFICDRTIDELEPFQEIDHLDREEEFPGESGEPREEPEKLLQTWRECAPGHPIRTYECKDCFAVPTHPGEIDKGNCNLFWFYEDLNQYFEPVFIDLNKLDHGYVEERKVTEEEFQRALSKKKTIVVHFKKAISEVTGEDYRVLAGPPRVIPQKDEDQQG